MERIEMSDREHGRLECLKKATDGVISQREAARKMAVADRRVRKQLKRMNERGDAVVVHGYERLVGCNN
jgi:Mn-dependent DtxR family transcriptional regulator